MALVKSPWPLGGFPPVNAFDSELQVQRSDDDDDGWAVWAHHGGDVQRAVVYFRGDAPADVRVGYRRGAEDADRSIEWAIREQLSRFMTRAPRAGMGFGAIVEVPIPVLDMESLVRMVDRYDDATGSVQWVVEAGLVDRRVLAARTWAHGYLTATYEGLLRTYGSMGFTVAQERKERRR